MHTVKEERKRLGWRWSEIEADDSLQRSLKGASEKKFLVFWVGGVLLKVESGSRRWIKKKLHEYSAAVSSVTVLFRIKGHIT